MNRATMPAQQKPKLRVVIVDDSSICRATLRAILQAEGDIEVVGEGEDGFEALPLVETLAPDLVTMDVQMPGKNGIEAVEQIMARKPVPIVVVTAEPLGDDSDVAFRAIENGALDVVAKPSFTDAHAGSELRVLVRKLAKTPVFQITGSSSPDTLPAPSKGSVELIAVVAGSGGMPSVLGLLSRLQERRLRCPLVIHQPVAREIVKSYAKHLAQVAKRTVNIVESGTVRCVNDEIVLIAGKHAMCNDRGVLVVDGGEPSASDLLASVAHVYGSTALGIALGGEGTDGIDGLRELRAKQAPTLAESPLSASVPELPAAAVNADVVDAALRIEELAERVHVIAAVV